MAKAKTTRASNLPVPQSDEDAAAAIARYGSLGRQIAVIDAGANNKIAKITADAAAQMAPFKEMQAAIEAGLETYCAAHRSRLTDGDKSKTAKFATGEVSWRTQPPKVSPSGKLAEIIARLKSLGLDRFLRTKDELDKEAMLKEPAIAAAVQGISISSGAEKFEIKPLQMVDGVRPQGLEGAS